MQGQTGNPLDAIRAAALPLDGIDRFDPLMDMVGDARFVLLGEATHGTADFYRIRADITRRLIEEAGFDAVAVEADWPDAYRVNRFIKGEGVDHSAVDAMGDFQRFPLWMWRNTEMIEFVSGLRELNRHRNLSARVGFYGLDLYSLYSSMAAVIDYLQQVDPDAAERARQRYRCFDHVGTDAEHYGYEVRFEQRPSCDEEAVAQLVELRRKRAEYLQYDGLLGEDAQFFAEQNARLVLNADEYYRGMFQSQVNTWNLRDSHMYETLVALAGHLRRQGRSGRVVVWEHNSHVGDARATAMSLRGEWNLGQLVRKEHGADALLVGFTTYQGTVTAASDWGAPVERKRLNPALQGSWEALFHDTGMERFLLPLRTEAIREQLAEPRLERAVGVVYLPQTERFSHYFLSRLPKQFDLLIHVDRTRALEPLDRSAGWVGEEAPETYPFGV